jgi:hypothetical protein
MRRGDGLQVAVETALDKNKFIVIYNLFMPKFLTGKMVAI